MGEAKRKQAELKKRLIEQCFNAHESPDPREREILAHIERLRFLEIPHERNARLLQHGYEPNECHTNSWRFVQRDPKKNSRIATGWMFTRVGYVAHSVVTNTDGGWMCVTPMNNDVEKLWFAEDPLITRKVISADEQRVMWKDDVCPQKVIINRSHFARMSQMAVDMLNKGKDPATVIGKMDEIFETCASPKMAEPVVSGPTL